MPSEAIAVVTTVGSASDAERIARAVVEQALGACAQISEIRSFYRWNGELQDDREYRVLIKTTDDRYAALEQAIRGLHPYDLPAIHAFAFVHVDPAYAAWVSDETHR
ncbi:divalent-cation tolerance protein CutA [Piscinibacter koreensis]|uniref:Divalent-cation tolerance protein CutA n=1 Tax=Piscinibacter koreensis TaxID=2742824 RepID=A0A7Y6TXC9_9BURK|nr:divalent-cation tolerance protein CutA [Schlegelella koreensis]NUZ06935.1 divalent-cation tolerance protein CutA [Schlegelella koreensis]